MLASKIYGYTWVKYFVSLFHRWGLCMLSYKCEIDYQLLIFFRGGYLVVPKAIEFWQGQSNRLHRRIQFTKEKRTDVEDPDVVREGSGWFYCVLSP